MSKTYAHYTESIKRNVVDAVRSGLSVCGMGKRLSIPLSTISQWVHSPRYSDVASALEEVLAAIPSLPFSEDDSPSEFGKVRKESGTGLRITMGKLYFESDSFTPETISCGKMLPGQSDIFQGRIYREMLMTAKADPDRNEPYVLRGKRV